MTLHSLVELDDDSAHLLTIGEYVALGETEHGYTELVEGRLLTSPSPAVKHRPTEEFGYQDNRRATGIFRTDEPSPVEIDLSRLV